jgi:hypothetical protein
MEGKGATVENPSKRKLPWREDRQRRLRRT